MGTTLATSLAALLAAAAPALAQDPLEAALAPRADWLSAASEPNRSMPQDDFDWTLSPGRTSIFDTSRTVIRGSLELGVEETRIVQGGVLRVRNLHVPEGATLKAEGPNPLVILASGDVRVDGRISVDGGDAASIFTLDMPTIPEQGAPGHAGGGNGGTGSRLIDSTTPRGGPGNGAFNLSADGGAGGDATFTDTYPPPTLVNTATDKGAGGGGGAGALLIFARGDVVLGPQGVLSAEGGHGNGGENTNWINRIGGGSGGGSGGHVIVQSLGRIDLSAIAPRHVAISARGGQGGEGNNGHDTPTTGEGGAGAGGEISPIADAKHTGAANDNPWIPSVPAECQLGVGIVTAAGGDGGPGVIQLHVGSLDDILPPGGDRARLAEIVVPPPIGYDGTDFVGRLIPAPF